MTAVSDLEFHCRQMFTAELQFRLAFAVRIAVNADRQPLDLPMEWVHGQHSVRYEEIALREDQAKFAADSLHRSATFLMAVAMKDAIRAAVHDPKASTDSNVRAAYRISRLVRNAFAHAPFSPSWSIDEDCRDQTFAIPELIEFKTAGLHGTPFDWVHYGGPLALFRLGRFVRAEILKAPPSPRTVVPIPNQAIYQQGNWVFEKVDQISPGAAFLAPSADGTIDLGDGHVLQPRDKNET